MQAIMMPSKISYVEQHQSPRIINTRQSRSNARQADAAAAIAESDIETAALVVAGARYVRVAVCKAATPSHVFQGRENGCARVFWFSG